MKRPIERSPRTPLGVTRMKWLAKAIFVCVSVVSVAAQKYDQPILLEVTVSSTGMVAPSGQHLYIRIFKDGIVEYEDEIADSAPPQFIIKRAKLNDTQLKSLVNFLQSSEVRNLSKEYPAIKPPLDHVVELSISIKNDGHSQGIAIINFSPTSREANRVYPASLIDLLCKIEYLRQSSFSVTTDPTKWCLKSPEAAHRRSSARRQR